MSDDDRDVDIESDDDDAGSCTSANDASRGGSQADKRAHHNALERKRRDHIKDSFCGLRDSVPSLSGEKVREKSSRAQILKKAAEYIQLMRRKNTSNQQDIDDLRKQNKVLEEQIRALDKAKNGGLSFGNASMLEKVKSESVSSLDCMSDSECGGASDAEGLNGDATNLSSGGSVPKDETCDSFGPPTTKRMKGSGSNSPNSRAHLSTR